MENFDKVTNHKIEKKKKEKRKNTDNISIWYTRYKYYALTKPAHLYWYQVTKALCLFLIIKRCGCNSLLPIH
jgi:ribosomal protein L44E